MSSKFFMSGEPGWQQVNEGMKRKILAYDKNMMMVLVNFSENAVGALHRHIHSQATYILSGVFEVTIGAETKLLGKGDSFVVPPDSLHGVVCRQEGQVLDAFSPAREDFLKA